jgi:hypothetical protein
VAATQQQQRLTHPFLLKQALPAMTLMLKTPTGLRQRLCRVREGAWQAGQLSLLLL